MSLFSEKETEYLHVQRLGRLATIGNDGAPHVVPVGFRLGADGEAIEVGGHGMGASKKWRDLQANPRIALVVDDLRSINPWTPRGIEVRGRAEALTEPDVVIRVHPERVISWGLVGERDARTVGR